MLATRRRFLQATLGSSTLLSAGLSVPNFLARTAQAADKQSGKSQDNVLVVVQLSGGNDGLNTVIPFADDAYGRNRIALRIAESQVLKIDDYIGFHPQMKGFAKLLEDKQLAVVQGVGYPNPDRSHFRSMDIWQSARRDVDDTSDGWLGRCLERSKIESGGDVPALHLGANQLPVALRSRTTAVPSMGSLESFRFRTTDGAVPLAALSQLAEAPRAAETPLLDFLKRSTLNAYASTQQVQHALESEKSAVQYPNHNLARKLQNIAQLIDAGLSTRIYYVSLDGFDTHSTQLGGHAALLRELAESVGAFIADLTGRGHADRVVVMSFSEFGRRVRENGSQGTDHGAAAPLFLAGGKVKSGAIGKHPSLTDLDEGDLKHHTDFRQVYATLLDQWLKCPSEAVLGKKFEHVSVLNV